MLRKSFCCRCPRGLALKVIHHDPSARCTPARACLTEVNIYLGRECERIENARILERIITHRSVFFGDGQEKNAQKRLNLEGRV